MGLQPPMLKDVPTKTDEPVTRVVDDISDTTEVESTEDHVEVLSKEDMAERLADADRRAAETVSMFVEQPPFHKHTKKYETKSHKKMRSKMQKKSRQRNR